MKHMQNPVISLKPATKADEPRLSQLLSDYQSELLPYSGHSEADIATYKYLPHYFTDPKRTASFILVGHEVAGFVLVNTHTLVEPHAHAIAEFYIAPAFRRGGVGAQAAAQTFAQFPGKWEVAQMATNQSAIQFWRSVIHGVTNGQYRETVLNTARWRGPVQIFEVR
jgi:predicted acetyltransferase